MSRIKVVITLFFVLIFNQSIGQVTTISQTIDGPLWYSGVNDWGGQSFTINQAGYLSEIRFFTDGAEGSTTVEIRQGQSTTGTLLYTTVVNVSAAGWFSVPLPNVAVCEGLYCFLLSDFQYGDLNNSDPYPGGQALYSGAWGTTLDMRFEIDQFIDEEPVNTTPFSNINVCQGNNILTSTFVIADENPNAVVATVVSSNQTVIPNANINTGGTGVNRSVNFVGPATTPGTTTITVTLDDGNCTNDYSFVVNVDPAPTANAGPDQTVCASSPSVNLSGTMGNASAVLWTTSGTGSFGSPTAPNSTYAPSLADITAGSVTLTFSTTGIGACGTVSDDMILTIQPNPTANAGANQTICEGDLANLAGTITGASGSVWSTSGTGGFADPVALNTTYNPSPNDIISGLVTLTLTTSGNGVCPAATSDIVLTINPLPTVTFAPLTDMCENDAPYTLVEGSPVGGTYSGPGVSAGNFDPGIATVGTHTLTFTYTDGNSCVNSANQTITVLANPTVIATSGLSPICDGNSTNITATGASVYSWDNGLGIGQNHSISPTSTTTYTVTGTAANGCENTDQITVVVNPLPTVTFGALSPLCVNGAPYTLVEGSPVGGLYSGPGVSGGGIDPTIAGIGTHTLYYNYIDGNGCSNVDSSDIEIYNNPVVVGLATGTNLCDGDVLTLTGSGANSYSWDNGVTDGVSFTPAVGSYNYVVTGFDLNGCSGTDTVMVTVNALPMVNAGADQTACDGSQVALSGAGAVSYIWDNGISDGVAFTPAVGTTVYIVTGTDANGCENTDTVNVIVNPNPILTVSPDQVFCLGDTVTLTASGADSYDWDSGAGSTATYQISPNSSVTVSLTGYNAFSCQSTETIDLILDDPNVIDAGADQTICEGFTVNLSASGGVDYVWNGPGIVSENNQNISFSVDTTAYYVVMVTTADGCNYPDSVLVSISTDPACTIETVTSITPNNDGVNDFWKIQGIEGFPDNHVMIYNRWGDIVFDENGYDNDLVKWDGMRNGNTLGAGTYFYLIEITNGPSQSGWIQLMK